MYLTEYLGLRGVGAAALTVPEATLLGIDNTVSGWVGRNAHVAVPEALANAVRNGAKKVELRALATSLINGALPLETASPKNQSINPSHAHEAMDRCHVLLCMLDDHLMNHPYVKADADVRREVEAASNALGRAYQLVGGFAHKGA